MYAKYQIIMVVIYSMMDGLSGMVKSKQMEQLVLEIVLL
ncbi:unnamed protein product [Thelazia callipaeda]|uniref:Uncharacterized protein n=1 Tax=Thelazia callipaeda TaxID=103827 RepID=A0A0N5D2H8_THECL|nr:unnamed protein product [Thelazia callipaeda]